MLLTTIIILLLIKFVFNPKLDFHTNSDNVKHLLLWYSLGEQRKFIKIY